MSAGEFGGGMTKALESRRYEVCAHGIHTNAPFLSVPPASPPRRPDHFIEIGHQIKPSNLASSKMYEQHPT
jgi:hypothetical protein